MSNPFIVLTGKQARRRLYLRHTAIQVISPLVDYDGRVEGSTVLLECGTAVDVTEDAEAVLNEIKEKL